MVDELIHIVCTNTAPLVNHLHAQLLVLQVVADLDLDGLTRAELQRILNQIYEDLLKANLIAHEYLRQTS